MAHDDISRSTARALLAEVERMTEAQRRAVAQLFLLYQDMDAEKGGNPYQATLLDITRKLESGAGSELEPKAK